MKIVAPVAETHPIRHPGTALRSGRARPSAFESPAGLIQGRLFVPVFRLEVGADAASPPVPLFPAINAQGVVGVSLSAAAKRGE